MAFFKRHTESQAIGVFLDGYICLPNHESSSQLRIRFTVRKSKGNSYSHCRFASVVKFPDSNASSAYLDCFVSCPCIGDWVDGLAYQ